MKAEAAQFRRCRHSARLVYGQPEQRPVHSHAGGGQIERATISTSGVGRLVMPAGHPRRGKSPRDTPARMLHCKCAGVDAVVGLAGQRVVNLDQIVPAQQPRGLHHAALIPVIASRDINGRSAAHDRGTAGLDVHRPAVHRELRDIALDDSHQPGRVAERRAHPVAPAAHAAAADIERDLRPPDGTRPL